MSAQLGADAAMDDKAMERKFIKNQIPSFKNIIKNQKTKFQNFIQQFNHHHSKKNSISNHIIKFNFNSKMYNIIDFFLVEVFVGKLDGAVVVIVYGVVIGDSGW